MLKDQLTTSLCCQDPISISLCRLLHQSVNKKDAFIEKFITRRYQSAGRKRCNVWNRRCNKAPYSMSFQGRQVNLPVDVRMCVDEESGWFRICNTVFWNKHLHPVAWICNALIGIQQTVTMLLCWKWTTLIYYILWKYLQCYVLK